MAPVCLNDNFILHGVCVCMYVCVFYCINNSPGSVVGSLRNFRVESKIELNLSEGLLVRKQNLGRHSRLVAIFLKLEFFKMADFCYGSLVSEKSVLSNMDLLYITGQEILMQNNFYSKEVHPENLYFQGYLRKTIPNHAITVKQTCKGL